jgi:hypothetical protein
MPSSPSRPSALAGNPDLLGIYLNDHLAGATGGTQLAWRAAAGGTAAAGDLRRFAAEVTQDRATLLQIMAALGPGTDPV